MDNLLQIKDAVPIVLALIISAAPHEMMHAFTAYKLGDDLAHSHGRISLNPMRHIDPILTIALPFFSLMLGGGIIMAAKPVPINTSRIRGGENGLALTALAGPLTNLVFAGLLSLPLNMMSHGGPIFEFTKILFLVNIGLFVFNMLPIPPLDGSRLVYAIAPRPVQRVFEIIESQGIFFFLILIMIFGTAIYPVIDKAQALLINFFIR
jgi:Zn-dependent protease